MFAPLNSRARAQPGPDFTTTHWKIVLSSKTRGSATARAALERLCRAYWPPIYAFLRRKGHTQQDAQDLAQEFFARLRQRETFAGSDRKRGRFRPYMLSTLRGFILDKHRQPTGPKCNGETEPVSLEDEPGEECYLELHSPELTPRELFDRRWRWSLIQQALGRLEAEFASVGKQRQFTLLREFLTGPATAGAYRPIAWELAISPRTVAVTIHRMRQRFRELVREEVAQTVTTPAEFAEEFKRLFG